MRLALALGLVMSVGTGALADRAYITSQNAEVLSLIETETGKTLASVPVAGKPAAVAVGAGVVAVVAVETKVLHLFDLTLKPLRSFALEGAPFGVAIDPAGLIWVSDAANGGSVIGMDPEKGSVTRLMAAANPTGLAHAEGRLVVAARDADMALIYPCPDCAAILVPTGHHPFGVALYEGRAFITNVLSNDVSVIDLATAREVTRIPTGERPYAVTFARDRGFVSNQYSATLTVFDARTLTPLAEVETGEYPEGLSTTPSGHVVVANWFSDTVQVFDPLTLELLQEVEMPSGPRAFGQFTAP